jgi:hypothetical protein
MREGVERDFFIAAPPGPKRDEDILLLPKLVPEHSERGGTICLSKSCHGCQVKYSIQKPTYKVVKVDYSIQNLIHKVVKA